jgi:multidrug efflux system membrane fusion protein
VSYRRLLLFVVLFVAASVTGCGGAASKVAPAEAPAIPVSQPVSRKVTEYVEFTGRTNAQYAVDIKARVTGFLVKWPFKEGALVQKGDLLFEIDPRPYQAQLDQQLGQVKLAQAQLVLAEKTLARDKAISKDAKGAVSQQQIDQDEASLEEAKARVTAQKAALEVYNLNMSFTRVTAPISGRISRAYLTEGNLVTQDQTLLTSIVSLDPIYIYFDMDEPTLLRIRDAVAKGKIKLPEKSSDIIVEMELQGEEGFPHKGSFNFIDSSVNPGTGSILVRGLFANPRLPGGDQESAALGLASAMTGPAALAQAALASWCAALPSSSLEGVRLLSPGMFVRIRLPIGQPQPALLVIDRAIGSDQDRKYVYVVGADGKVAQRRVTTGPLEDDGLRVVQGVKADEWVVVGALQQVRPGTTVQTDRITMPSLGPDSAGQRAPAAKNGERKAPPKKS